MNIDKIEQCKADIDALKKNLKQLEEEENRKKLEWVNNIRVGSLVCSCNNTVYMLCSTSHGYEFTLIKGLYSGGRGQQSGKLDGCFLSINDVREKVRKAAKWFPNEIKLFTGTITLKQENKNVY